MLSLTLRIYISARPSRGPQVGRSDPGLGGRDIREQLTLFSAIICITVFRQPDLDNVLIKFFFPRFINRQPRVSLPAHVWEGFAAALHHVWERSLVVCEVGVGGDGGCVPRPQEDVTGGVPGPGDLVLVEDGD